MAMAMAMAGMVMVMVMVMVVPVEADATDFSSWSTPPLANQVGMLSIDPHVILGIAGDKPLHIGSFDDMVMAMVLVLALSN